MKPHAPARIRLGDMLVRTGAISADQLRAALAEQDRTHRPIGQTLLALGFVTDETMRQALGAQLNVPYIDLDRVAIDRGLSDLVDREFAARHHLMPVARIGPTLTVAMDDPTASAVVADLARMTGLTINLVTSSGRAIAGAFERAYGTALPSADGDDSPAPAETPPAVSLSLDWVRDMEFKSSAGFPAIELQSSSPTVASPPQALAYAVMACMAMDVVHVLKKTRCDVKALTVRFEGERAAEPPRRFVSMRLHFDLTGQTASHIVERAIELSRTKYCSVWNTLRTDVSLETSFTIRPPTDRSSSQSS